MHCLTSSKQTYPLDTMTRISQLRKEALPETAQLGSGRVEAEFGLQAHVAGLCCFTPWQLREYSF